MNKTIVLYGSHYGATKAYARHIAGQLGCAAAAAEQIKELDLSAYDTVIFGGGLYAGSVAGWNKAAKYCGQKEGQRWILFSCGLADPASAKTQNEVRTLFESRLPDELRGKLPVFCLRGGMDYAKLGLKHRTMMAALMLFLRRKKDKTEEDEQLLQTYGQKSDFFDESSVQPILDEARRQ